MALYDFQHMLKRLWLPYLVILALHLLFLRGDKAGAALLLLGLLISAWVNFSLFWRDYMGKNALLINTLPMGSLWKVFCKLLWGVLFSVMFYCVYTAASVFFLRRGIVVLNLVGVGAVILFFLNGYSAMGAFKNCGGWYYIFCGIILFNAVSVFLGAAVFSFGGISPLLAAVALMCLFQLVMSAVNIAR